MLPHRPAPCHDCPHRASSPVADKEAALFLWARKTHACHISRKHLCAGAAYQAATGRLYEADQTLAHVPPIDR